jgi:uncharacterized Zn finger protein
MFKHKTSFVSVEALVPDAVMTIRPEWLVCASKHHAEGLIARKVSKYYAAAEWLKRVKIAYPQSAEWRAYLDHLKQGYSRRPALQAQLQRLERSK